MNIVWLSWKDRSHPEAGGAETISGEIMDRLVRDGHKVKHLTARYSNSLKNEITPLGIEIHRAGSRYSVYTATRKQYKEQRLDSWAEIVIDEMNTIPFAAAFYSRAPKKALFAYQLAREVWFYQMIFPLSVIGYVFEPLMLRTVSKRYPITITESDSSARDLKRHGFKNVSVIHVGVALSPLKLAPQKKLNGLILSLGAIRPMKRTLHAVKAFEMARDTQPSLRMVIAGDASGIYAQKLRTYVGKSRHTEAIEILGRVTNHKRLELMRAADAILVTSIKEGWGLIVTEANTQGTPAIVYDVDGLRDSVINDKTGLTCTPATPAKMAERILELENNDENYDAICHNAWQWSQEFTFERSYRDFLSVFQLPDSKCHLL